jgi:hypothetical protein
MHAFLHFWNVRLKGYQLHESCLGEQCDQQVSGRKPIEAPLIVCTAYSYVLNDGALLSLGSSTELYTFIFYHALLDQ